MAVNMNERDPVRLILCVFIIFYVILQVVLSSTTTSVSTAANTTAATTTTTTTVSTTTTTISPQQKATIFDAHTLLYACSCDLTGIACDVNCCCDEDCSRDDKKTFSQCLPFSASVDNRLCARDEVIAFENNDPVISEITDDNLFCIYYDNKEERNYYTNPEHVQLLASFEEYRREFPSFSFQASSATLIDFESPFYKAGDLVYTVSEGGVIGVLGLPQTLTTTQCLDHSPAGFLTDQSARCVRSLHDCKAAAPGLDVNNFITGFRVVTSPRLFQVLNTSIAGTNNFYSLYNNSLTIAVELDSTTAVSPVLCYDQASGLTGPCAFSTSPLPSPTLALNTCDKVVQQVHYRVLTEGTSGIRRVLARVVLTSLAVPSGGTVNFTQSFSIAFEAVRSSNSYVRSGHPGYVWGQPLLAGVLNQTSDTDPINYQIFLSSSRDHYMTVVRASASGDCFTDSDTRIPIMFGHNIRTGCLLRVSAANLTEYCRLLQQKIIEVMEFDCIPEVSAGVFHDTNRYVGLFGNSDVSKTGDWVRVSYENRLLPSASLGTSGCQLSLGMHIQVLYASVGAVDNPQHKVLGVSYIYSSPTTVLIRPTLSGRYNQPVEISASVAFVDVSKPAVAAQGEAPIFLAKLPYDFFYPFISAAPVPRALLMSAVIPLVLALGQIWS